MDTNESNETRWLATGTWIGGGYRVVRPLAEGGMGAIYEVDQVATGARRALKVMHGQFASDPDLRARFEREARLAASIPSDHVAQIVDAGQDDVTGALYIVMELLDGTTLARELRRTGPFPWSAAVEILGQIAHALSAAHVMGIVHRDLKPANVFLARSRHAVLPFTVKLLDFGIAKAIAGASDATAAIVGTPAWMAPEQTALDSPIGPPADVWSFGLLAFLVLTGSHYFASANAKSVPTAAVLRELIVEPLVPASARAREVGAADRLPDGFDEWFARCVDRSPENRFPDAGVAYEAFRVLPAPLATASVPIEAWRDTSPAAPQRAYAPMDTPVTTIEAPRSPRTRTGDTKATRTHAPATITAPRNSMIAGPWRVSWVVAAASMVFAVVAGLAWKWRGGNGTSADVAVPAASPAPAETADHVVLRLHGSNTIGGELAPALAEAFLQKATGVRAVVRKRTGPDELLVEARDGDRTIEAIEIFAHGTATGFSDLAQGRCDVAMASRRITPDEIHELARWGDLSSPATEHVIALDGIAVIVNPSSRVASLTEEQIAGLFTGKIPRWTAIDGEDATAIVHARDDKSGTYDTFKHLVLGGAALAPDARRHESSEELSDAVAADPRAIGFIGLPYVRSAKAVMVQSEHGAPLLPSPMTVSSEDYPLARRLYLYAPLSSSPVARDFIDFAQSTDGQRLAQQSGFVDLRPTCDKGAAACPSCPTAYREAVRGACRLSTTFRFDPSTGQLDARALADLPRVVTMLGQSEYAGRSVLLFGFSAPSAKASEGIADSLQRAETVASQLRARGLHVEAVRGLGAQMPPAGAGDDERTRAARVETWLR